MQDQRFLDRNLRIAPTSERACTYCYFFRITQIAYPSDEGLCSQYADDFVRGDFICDGYMSTEASHEQSKTSVGYTPDLLRDDNEPPRQH